MAATAPVAPPAPTAPPSGVTIVDSGPPKPPPAPTSQIRVSQMPAPADPDLAKPKGKAFDRLRADLAKKAKPSSFEAATPSPEPSPAATPPATAPALDDPRPTDTPNATGEDPSSQGSPPSDTPPAATEKGKDEKGNKVSPWKLVDQFKERVTKAEARVLELEKQLLPDADRKLMTERLATAEKRAKELDDEIQFVNYQKSSDFKDNYQKPYEEAWKRAMGELGELTINVNGHQRQVTPDDILQLVQAPLGRAREIANQVFGDFADDVMAHRKEIKSLMDKQSARLTEMREKGAERDKVRNFELQAKTDEIKSFINTTWEKVNTALLADEKLGRFLKPIEGDQEGNQKLAKGYEIVDRAMNENSSDPNLTPEQRASVIKRHAAVRHRAAAFGRLVYLNGQLESKLADLQKKLDGYKSSAPPVSGSQPAPEVVPQAGTAMGRMFGELRKIAKTS